MRFKLDENLPTEVAEYLRARGHDAETVHEEHLDGEPDSVIASVARAEERILATLDRDFADLRAFPPSRFPGPLVFRVVRQDPGYLLSIWARVLDLLNAQSAHGELWIVEERGVRRRTDGE